MTGDKDDEYVMNSSHSSPDSSQSDEMMKSVMTGDEFIT